ncbi:hypothetical protein ACU635_60940 [[Actinomadura] parvosata]|uniref:hypothetical protein n=1 Tax=[Actinomadura] parvosata TaxID=1955412 RepID=UPI00406CD60B
MPIQIVPFRGAALAWHAFDLITAPDCTTWDQTTWRSHERRGTAYCYGSHLALAAGGCWLVRIDTERQQWIDDQPVTATDSTHLNGSIEQYLIAEAGDPAHLLETARGKKVIHVRFRAAHLIGLDPEEPHEYGGLFDPRLTTAALADLLERRIGPRP